MKAWTDFLTRLESSLGSESVNKWLRSLKIVHFDAVNLYLEAQDPFQVQWFEEQIRPRLKTQLLNPNFRPIKVHLTLSDTAVKPRPQPAIPLSFTPDTLNPLMSFEHFIWSPSNTPLCRFFEELASGSNPGYNPIYLWGPSGVGKTHLLMALAQALKQRGRNALYVRAETFTAHVVSAIRASEMHAFRKHYRQVDLLLIDDVHQLARKYATQEEFFHTFNTLHASGRQILLSAPCSPAQLEEIEPRLISRFEWGINLHLEPPPTTDLKEILTQRTQALRFPLSEAVSEFLLTTFSTSQSLYKALETLVLRSHLEHIQIDIDTAKRMLTEVMAQDAQHKLSPEKIYAAVCAVYGIRPEDLLGKSQTQECSLPRQLAMYLCRKDLLLPFQAIGRLFGRDHSTVMTSVRQIEKKLIDADPETLTPLQDVRRLLS